MLQIRKKSNCDDLGRLITEFNLIDAREDGSGESTFISNLSTKEGGALYQLSELNNSIHSIFLSSALNELRDSIISSRSYGMNYLFEKCLEHLDSPFLDCSYNAESHNSRNELAVLPNLLAVLTAPFNIPESSLENLQRRFYFPDNIIVNSMFIRRLLKALEERFEAQQSSAGCLLNGEDRNPVTSTPVQFDARSTVAYKLTVWATRDIGDWCEFSYSDTIQRIDELCSHIRTHVEVETGMRWDRIVDNMVELSVIEVQQGTSKILMTTRPTSGQLNILFRLGLQPPKQIIGVSNLAQERIYSESSKVGEKSETILEDYCSTSIAV